MNILVESHGMPKSGGQIFYFPMDRNRVPDPPLGATELANLQVQCSFIHILGSGAGRHAGTWRPREKALVLTTPPTYRGHPTFCS